MLTRLDEERTTLMKLFEETFPKVLDFNTTSLIPKMDVLECNYITQVAYMYLCVEEAGERRRNGVCVCVCCVCVSACIRMCMYAGGAGGCPSVSGQGRCERTYAGKGGGIATRLFYIASVHGDNCSKKEPRVCMCVCVYVCV